MESEKMDGRESETQISVDEVFRDYLGRRAAIITALTTDVEEFFRQCDPEKKNLCLYGLPNGQWQVSLPAAEGELPSLLALPTLSISSARSRGDKIEQHDWLPFIAANCDTWLLSVVSFNASGFDKPQREHLFTMIDNLPTVHGIITGKAKKQQIEKSSSAKNGSKSRTNPTAEEKTEEEHCICGAKGDSNEFWILCDFCETWYHGKCVEMTAEEAKHLDKYKCPSCRGKSGRVWQYCMRKV